MVNNVQYYDNASTTRVDPRVLQVMLPYMLEHFGNPSATNFHSIKPREAINKAREQVSSLIGSDSGEVVFNSGSTEGINHVLKSLFLQNTAKRKNHLIVSQIEHKATLNTCEYLETIGCEVTYINTCSDGVINLKELQKAIREDTFLVVVMYVNNETGVIQPIKEVVKLAKTFNVPVFTDATQAVGRLSIRVRQLNVDYLCFSAHKIYGPKGSGTLYIKSGQKLMPHIHGGNQQKEMRGGTLNVPGIVGLGKACELAKLEMSFRNEITVQKKSMILRKFVDSGIGVENFKKVEKVPHITSITLKHDLNDDFLLNSFNEFSASTGSACNSEIIEESHVLRSIPGIDPKKVIRLSI